MGRLPHLLSLSSTGYHHHTSSRSWSSFPFEDDHGRWLHAVIYIDMKAQRSAAQRHGGGYLLQHYTTATTSTSRGTHAARRTPHTQRRRRSSSSTLTKRDVIWGKLKRKEGLLDRGESSQLRIYNPLLEFERLKRKRALNRFLGFGTWDEEKEGKVFWLTIVKSSVGLALASDWSADWTDV